MATVAGPPVSPPVAPARPPAGGAQTPSRSVIRRRRLLALVGVGIVLALASAAWFALTSSGAQPPATGALTVVPDDALAYVNLSIDPARPAVRQARAMAAHFPDWPLLQAAAQGRLTALVGGSSTQMRSWLGNEEALALLPAADGSVQSLIALDVAHRSRARAFLTSSGASPSGVYDGVRLLALPSGGEAAFIGHYLVAGPDASIRAAIAAERGRARSLAHDETYQRAAAGEPSDRVLDAYLPAAGIRRLLTSRTGVAGAIGVLLGRPGVQGATVSVSPTPGGAQVLVHSALAAGTAPARAFTPTLQSVLPSGSALMVDVDGLDHAAPQLLAATATAGIAGNVGPMLRRLGAALVSEGVDVHKVVSIFSGETALAVAPGAAPALLIVSRVRDEAAARSELAALEAPLTTLFSPSQTAAAGQVPELSDTEFGGATVHELQLGPGLQLDFGVFDGLAVVSTSVAAIGDVAQRARALAADGTYRSTLPAQHGPLSSLVFADLSRLVPLAQQLGLTSGARTRELLPDLAKVRAVGLRTAAGKNDMTTELRLEIR